MTHVKARSKQYWKAYKPWKKVSSAEWHDWNWQYHHLIRTVDELAEIIPYTVNHGWHSTRHEEGKRLRGLLGIKGDGE